MSETRKDFQENAVLLTRLKIYNDYLKCANTNSGIEPESFFEKWEKDFLLKVDEDFRSKIWRGFLELLYINRK